MDGVTAETRIMEEGKLRSCKGHLGYKYTTKGISTHVFDTYRESEKSNVHIH